jgi:hypothetical protein
LVTGKLRKYQIVRWSFWKAKIFERAHMDTTKFNYTNKQLCDEVAYAVLIKIFFFSLA